MHFSDSNATTTQEMRIFITFSYCLINFQKQKHTHTHTYTPMFHIIKLDIICFVETIFCCSVATMLFIHEKNKIRYLLTAAVIFLKFNSTYNNVHFVRECECTLRKHKIGQKFLG